jgi:hypothetical protein
MVCRHGLVRDYVEAAALRHGPAFVIAPAAALLVVLALLAWGVLCGTGGVHDRARTASVEESVKDVGCESGASGSEGSAVGKAEVVGNEALGGRRTEDPGPGAPDAVVRDDENPGPTAPHKLYAVRNLATGLLRMVGMPVVVAAAALVLLATSGVREDH